MKTTLIRSAVLGKKRRRRETLPDIARRIPVNALRPFLKMTQVSAAKAMGISPTTLKKLCRHYGIARWPFRQIAGIDRAFDRLHADLDPSLQGSSAEDNALNPVAAHIEKLQHHREEIVKLALLKVDDPARIKKKKSAQVSVDAMATRGKGTTPAVVNRFPSTTRPSHMLDKPMIDVTIRAGGVRTPHGLTKIALQPAFIPYPTLRDKRYSSVVVSPGLPLETNAVGVPSSKSRAASAVVAKHPSCAMTGTTVAALRLPMRAGTDAVSIIAATPPLQPSPSPTSSVGGGSVCAVASPTPQGGVWSRALYCGPGTAARTAAAATGAAHPPSLDGRVRVSKNTWVKPSPANRVGAKNGIGVVVGAASAAAVTGEPIEGCWGAEKEEGMAVEDLDMLEELMLGDIELFPAATDSHASTTSPATTAANEASATAGGIADGGVCSESDASASYVEMMGVPTLGRTPGVGIVCRSPTPLLDTDSWNSMVAGRV